MDREKEKSFRNWAEIYNIDVLKDYGSWENYFARDLYEKNVPERKFRQINLIKNNASIKRPILEAGCGLANLATYFAKHGYDVHGVDNDEGQLAVARKNSEIFTPNNPVNLQKGDICNLPFERKSMGLSFSNGVLEHFSDDEIIHIINEQLRVADKMIFGVPSTWYAQFPKMCGNERYMERDEWRDIIKRSKAKILSEHDLGHTSEIRAAQLKLPPEHRKESFIGWVLQDKELL